MILWNRSKVLLDLGHGDLAVQDLQLALQSGLPGKQKGEYYWRLANCYSGLNEFNDKIKKKTLGLICF